MRTPLVKHTCPAHPVFTFWTANPRPLTHRQAAAFGNRLVECDAKLQASG